MHLRRGLALACVSAAVGCSSMPPTSGAAREADLLRRYTLSQCIARAYPETSVAKDARAAGAGYLEFGSLAIEAYQDAAALAEATVQREYQGKGGEPLHVMKCLDLLGAPELDRLVERHVR